MRHSPKLLVLAIAAGAFLSRTGMVLAQAEYYEGTAFRPPGNDPAATPRYVSMVVQVEAGRVEIRVTVPGETAVPLVAELAGGGASETVSLTAQSTIIYPAAEIFHLESSSTRYVISVEITAIGGWRTVLNGNPPSFEVNGFGVAPYTGSLRRIGRPENGKMLVYAGTVRSDGSGPFGYSNASTGSERCVLILDQQPGRRLASEVTAVLILYGTRDGQRYQRFGPRGQETSVERPAILMKEALQNRWALAAGSVKRDTIAGTDATILTGRSADWNQPPRLLNGMWTSIVVEDLNLPIPFADPESIALSQLNLHLVSDPESANESFAGTVARIRANLRARGFIERP